MRNSDNRFFLAVLIGCLVAWIGGGVLTAQVPPPITRSVLTTNIPAFGTAGQALFRTTAGPYLNWSNIASAITGQYIASSNGLGSNTTFYPGTASSNYPPVVIYASAITNGFELRDANSNLVMCITTNGRVLLPAGTNNFPSLGFLGDDDGTGTGFYRYAANAVRFAQSGSTFFELNSGGYMVIPSSLRIGTSSSTTFGTANPSVIWFHRDLNPMTNQLYNTYTSTNSHILESGFDRPYDWFFLRTVNRNTGTDPTTNKALAISAGTTNWQMKFETNGDVSVKRLKVDYDGGLNPVGAYGSLMMNATNIVVCAGAASVYTNVAGTGFTTIATNGFYGDITGNSSALTNLYAGYYLVTICASALGAGNQPTEWEIFTNNVACDLVGWKKTYDAAARMDGMSATGVIYLPANCRTDFRVQDAGTGGSIAIHRASLTIGTP